jgi:hypothetical protein
VGGKWKLIGQQLDCSVTNKKIAIGNTGSGMRYFSFSLKKTLQPNKIGLLL